MPTYTYANAQQVADFGIAAPTGTIVRIYQISSRVGRGKYATITI